MESRSYAVTSESCFYISRIIIQRDAAICVTLDYPSCKTLGIPQELLLTRFPNANHNSPRGYTSSLLRSGFLGCFCKMLLDSFEQSVNVFAYVFCIEFSNDFFQCRFVVATVTGYLSGCGRFE